MMIKGFKVSEEVNDMMGNIYGELNVSDTDGTDTYVLVVFGNDDESVLVSKESLLTTALEMIDNENISTQGEYIGECMGSVPEHYNFEHGDPQCFFDSKYAYAILIARKALEAEMDEEGGAEEIFERYGGAVLVSDKAEQPVKEISRRSFNSESEGFSCGPWSILGADAEIVVEDEGHTVFLHGQWCTEGDEILFEATQSSVYDIYVAASGDMSAGDCEERDRISSAGIRDYFPDVDIEKRYAIQCLDLEMMLQEEVNKLEMRTDVTLTGRMW